MDARSPHDPFTQNLHRNFVRTSLEGISSYARLPVTLLERLGFQTSKIDFPPKIDPNFYSYFNV